MTTENRGSIELTEETSASAAAAPEGPADWPDPQDVRVRAVSAECRDALLALGRAIVGAVRPTTQLRTATHRAIQALEMQEAESIARMRAEAAAAQTALEGLERLSAREKAERETELEEARRQVAIADTNLRAITTPERMARKQLCDHWGLTVPKLDSWLRGPHPEPAELQERESTEPGKLAFPRSARSERADSKARQLIKRRLAEVIDRFGAQYVAKATNCGESTVRDWKNEPTRFPALDNLIGMMACSTLSLDWLVGCNTSPSRYERLYETANTGARLRADVLRQLKLLADDEDHIELEAWLPSVEVMADEVADLYDRRWTLHVNLRRVVEEATSASAPDTRAEALRALEAQLTDSELGPFPNRPPFGSLRTMVEKAKRSPRKKSGLRAKATR